MLLFRSLLDSKLAIKRLFWSLEAFSWVNQGSFFEELFQFSRLDCLGCLFLCFIFHTCERGHLKTFHSLTWTFVMAFD